MQFTKIKFYTEGGDIDQLLDNIKILEQENDRLKSEIKSQNNSFRKEKFTLKQENSVVKDKANDTVELIQNRDIDESIEIEELRDIKNKLEKEIANLQRDKSEYFNEIIEECDEKVNKAVKVAEKYKSR